MTDHIITIHLFANLKEKAGTSSIKLELPDKTTVKELKNLIKRDFPELSTQLNNVVVLADQSQIKLDSDILHSDTELSILPPISGG